MSLAENVLARLEGVKPQGTGRWLAKCPAHQDRSPSFAVSYGDDGRLLLHCHAGCSNDAVLSALGLEYSDLFPDLRPRRTDGRRPFPAEALRSVEVEATTVALYARRLSNGGKLSESDIQRLMVAAGRISQAVTEATTR